MRRWVFLPALATVVPILVMIKGGDALSVCFNTVAILFLCNIDNVAYAVGLSERLRTRVEQFGHVELEDAEADALVRAKAVHVVLIVATLLWSVSWGASGGDYAREIAELIPIFAFWAGGVDESVTMPGTTAAEKAKGACKATGAFVLGIVANVSFRIIFNL